MQARTALTVFLLAACTAALAQSPLSGLSDDDIADGGRLFRIHCARCHGIDGAGGEGSNLVRARLRFAPDDESLIDLISDGIPGTGMPDIWSLDEQQTLKVAGYVRSLGRLPVEAMPGDPSRGEEIYRRSGGCPACHIVAGYGTGIGPELTDVGARRGRAYLTNSLLAPADSQSQTRGYQDFLTVRVSGPFGTLEGLRVNEDAFTIQIRDLEGTIHSLRKSELTGFQKLFGHSLMPAYRAALSDRDIDDVVSYLMSLRSEP